MYRNAPSQCIILEGKKYEWFLGCIFLCLSVKIHPDMVTQNLCLVTSRHAVVWSSCYENSMIHLLFEISSNENATPPRSSISSLRPEQQKLKRMNEEHELHEPRQALNLPSLGNSLTTLPSPVLSNSWRPSRMSCLSINSFYTERTRHKKAITHWMRYGFSPLHSGIYFCLFSWANTNHFNDFSEM